jgi:hypothetical protein
MVQQKISKPGFVLIDHYDSRIGSLNRQGSSVQMHFDSLLYIDIVYSIWEMFNLGAIPRESSIGLVEFAS